MRPVACHFRITLQKNICGIRGYRLPAGTYPAKDPRSIFDSRVQYLWYPEKWTDIRNHAQGMLMTAATNAFGAQAGKVEERCLKLFFVPYWMVRLAVYSPIDHATSKRDYTEGRIAMDVTFPLSVYTCLGASHPALRTLHFLTPTTEPLNLQASTTPPLDNCIYVPFSEAPPLHWRTFFQTMSTNRDVMLSRNLRIRPRESQCQIAARPYLEPLVLGEYTHKAQNVTAAYCPRLVEPDIRIFRYGGWTRQTDSFGPSRVSMSIAWSGEDPLGEDADHYKPLEELLQTHSRAWLEAASSSGGSTSLTPTLWASAAASKEGFDSVRSWQKAKVHLYNEGYELQKWTP